MLPWALGSAATTWDLSQSEAPSQFGVWLEGVARSGACRDITLEITFAAAGAEPLVDRVNLTVFEVTSLTPAGDAMRAMISTLHDNGNYSDHQSVDGEVLITATVEPAEAGVPVYFLTEDPDDLSPYEVDQGGAEDLAADDNRHEDFEYGALTVADGYPDAGTTTVYGPFGRARGRGAETVIDEGVATAAVVLVTTWQHAGDSYRVYANPCTGPDLGDAGTALIVAWKRWYLEVDEMYTWSMDLAADFHKDADAAPDVIEVVSTAPFVVRQELTIFQRKWTPEDVTVAGIIDGTHLLLNEDLAADYGAGYAVGNSWSFGAAVTTRGCATITGDVHGLLTSAFGAAPDGSDGGAFVEFVELPRDPNVPGSRQAIAHRETLTGTAEMGPFSYVWFDAWDWGAGAAVPPTNLFHVVLGETGFLSAQPDPIALLGATVEQNNYTFLFTKNIADGWLHGVPAICADVSAHELAHQSLGPPHCTYAAHDGMDLCVMSMDRDRTDANCEFCAGRPLPLAATDEHVDKIRGAADAL